MGFFDSVKEKVEAGAAWTKRTSASAVRQASSAATATRDALDRAAQRTKEAAAAAATAAAQKAREGAAWTRDRAVEGAEWTKEKARQAAQKAREGAEWTRDRAVEGAEWTRDKAVAGAGWTRDRAVEGAEWTKKKAGEAAGWANKKGQQATNWAAGKAAAGIGSAATGNKTVERCLDAALRDKARKASPQDGQFMGNDCPKSSANPPKTGRLPQGCAGQGGKLPKIIYTNGINTPPEAACATMRNIANQRCAEVIGVYNATYGTVQDALDSRDNIDRAGREPAAHSQAWLMSEMLTAKPSQKVTVYAHSQGGLITQEGLNETDAELQQSITVALRRQGMSAAQAKREATLQTRQKMSKIDVYSFGTAERNWPPVGSRYHQYTNTADPVPKLIGAVQANRGTSVEPTNLVERHRFEQNAWNPIAPHSMDDVYLAALNRTHPVPKKANGQCC